MDTMKIIEVIIIRLDAILRNFSLDPYYLYLITIKSADLNLNSECFKSIHLFERCLKEVCNKDLTLKRIFLGQLKEVNVNTLTIRDDIKDRIISFASKGAKIFISSILPRKKCEEILRKENILEHVNDIVCGDEFLVERERINALLNRHRINSEKIIYVGELKFDENFKGIALPPDEFIKTSKIEEEFC